ncbi:MAG: hypothetical protein JXQ72_17865, partial [Anaerolineae bacterium]|nr:hypothetical protein [Anaerolineae bacterium]
APRASSDPAIPADPALALDPTPEPDTVLPISPEPETAPVPPAAPADIPAPRDIPPDAVPSFVADLTRDQPAPDYSHTADTEPKAPPELREAIEAQQIAQQPVRESAPKTAPVPPAAPVPVRPAPVEAAPQYDLPDVPIPRDVLEGQQDGVPDYQRPTPPRGTSGIKPAAAPPESPAKAPEPAPVLPPPRITPPPVVMTPSREMPRVDVPKPPDIRPEPPVRSARPEPPAPPPMPPRTASNLPPQTPTTDTGEISIWEVFGLARPSDQDNAALNDLIQEVEAKKQTAEFAAIAKASRFPVRRATTVLGLRLRLALERVRVRWKR